MSNIILAIKEAAAARAAAQEPTPQELQNLVLFFGTPTAARTELLRLQTEMDEALVKARELREKAQAMRTPMVLGRGGTLPPEYHALIAQAAQWSAKHQELRVEHLKVSKALAVLEAATRVVPVPKPPIPEPPAPVPEELIHRPKALPPSPVSFVQMIVYGLVIYFVVGSLRTRRESAGTVTSSKSLRGI